MEEMNALERQLANVVRESMRPPRPVDAAAIVRAATSDASTGQMPAITRWFRGSSSVLPEGGFSMFSAVKIVAAAAIVALFGGILLVGVVGDPDDGELPPAAVSPSPSVEPAAHVPTEFTGTFACSTYWQDGQTRNVVLGPVDGGNLVRKETRGELGRFDAEMSDSRLQGDWTVYTSTDEYFWPEGDAGLPLTMAPGVLHITNDEGSWRQPWGYFSLPGAMTDSSPGWVGYLTGTGAYDGLTALYRLTSVSWDDCYCWNSKGLTAAARPCHFEMEGLIVDGVPPAIEVPE